MLLGFERGGLGETHNLLIVVGKLWIEEQAWFSGNVQTRARSFVGGKPAEVQTAGRIANGVVACKEVCMMYGTSMAMRCERAVAGRLHCARTHSPVPDRSRGVFVVDLHECAIEEEYPPSLCDVWYKCHSLSRALWVAR